MQTELESVSVPLRGLDMRKHPICSRSQSLDRIGFSPLAGIRYAET